MTQEGTEPRAWQQKAFQHTAKAVRKSCNNGWMSELEQEARILVGPMATGTEPLPLNEDQQKLLAFWAVKTAFMVACIHPKDERHIPAKHFRKLYKLREPLPKMGVFMAFRNEAYGDGGKHAAGFMSQNVGEVRHPRFHRRLDE